MSIGNALAPNGPSGCTEIEADPHLRQRDMAAFGPVASRVIYVDSDGPIVRDYRRIPYTRINRPVWPLDEVAQPGLILSVSSGVAR
jgi:hypothetical protein